MATNLPGRVPGSAPERRGPALGAWAAGRQRNLDNLKVVLIALIIALHGILGYTGSISVWSYTEVREVTLSPLVEMALLVTVSPFGFFVIALLFLVAGLLAPASLARKGPGPYARDRLLRLGVPFILYVLIVQPVVMYALGHPLGIAPGSYWHEFLGEERRIDSGPLWFVGVLLVFSLVYAGWARAARWRGPAPGEITVRHLLLVAAAVVPASFLVRLVYPYGGESGFTDLNLWEWPACAAVFGIGIVASRQGWLTAVPERLARQCRTVTLSAVLAMVGLLAVVGALDAIDAAMGGANAAAAAFAVIEGTLTVFGPVWLLRVAQRRLDRPIPSGPRLARGAYGAFMVQTPVLIGLAVALRPVPLAAEVKAVTVAGLGVAASFALARLLIERIPGVTRVL